MDPLSALLALAAPPPRTASLPVPAALEPADSGDAAPPALLGLGFSLGVATLPAMDSRLAVLVVVVLLLLLVSAMVKPRGVSLARSLSRALRSSVLGGVGKRRGRRSGAKAAPASVSLRGVLGLCVRDGERHRRIEAVWRGEEKRVRASGANGRSYGYACSAPGRRSAAIWCSGRSIGRAPARGETSPATASGRGRSGAQTWRPSGEAEGASMRPAGGPLGAGRPPDRLVGAGLQRMQRSDEKQKAEERMRELQAAPLLKTEDRQAVKLKRNESRRRRRSRRGRSGAGRSGAQGWIT